MSHTQTKRVKNMTNLTVWKLSEYEDDNYSYSGRSICEEYFFTSKEKALAWASENAYTVEEWCSDSSTVVTINSVRVI